MKSSLPERITIISPSLRTCELMATFTYNSIRNFPYILIELVTREVTDIAKVFTIYINTHIVIEIIANGSEQTLKIVAIYLPPVTYAGIRKDRMTVKGNKQSSSSSVHV